MQQQTTVLHQIQYLQYLLLQQRHHQQQVQTTPLPAHIPQQLFGAPFALPYGHFYGMMPPQMVPEQMRPQGPQMILPARAHVPAMAPVNRQNPWMVVDMAREVVSLLDLRMAIKMAFMLVIIGQDMSTDRMLMLGLLSLISYLYITGILAKIHEVYKRHRSVHGDPAPNAPAGPNARGAEANADAAMADRHSIFTRVLRISADRGFVQDIKYFVVGLLLSLVPAWHPQPLHGAAPVHGDAVPNNMPLQEM